MSYCTAGIGKGEIHLSLDGVERDDLSRVVVRVKRMAQVTSVAIEDRGPGIWLNVMVNTQHLAGDHVDSALSKLHSQIASTIGSNKKQLAASSSA